MDRSVPQGRVPAEKQYGGYSGFEEDTFRQPGEKYQENKGFGF